MTSDENEDGFHIKGRKTENRGQCQMSEVGRLRTRCLIHNGFFPAPLAGFGSSRSSTADISLCFFPFDELRFSGLDIAFALPQLFLVPGGRFDRARICRQALPKRFHRLQLFFDAHFVQWENRNAHVSMITFFMRFKSSGSLPSAVAFSMKARSLGRGGGSLMISSQRSSFTCASSRSLSRTACRSASLSFGSSLMVSDALTASIIIWPRRFVSAEGERKKTSGTRKREALLRVFS